MASGLPESVDTVIIGNGPSALILSYILHGHIPFYDGEHHDRILHNALSESPNLLCIGPELYEHFHSSLRYSTQALPINTLLDTLIRPNADTEVNPKSCIKWRYKPKNAMSHVVLGDAPRPGGQWVENPVAASWDIGTLGYAEMLSLPGYSFAEHYEEKYNRSLSEFVRPSRVEMADYLAVYPKAVGISDAIFTSITVRDVSRTSGGFLIGSHNIRCRHLVLASGIFSINIPPPPLLAPLLSLSSPEEPLLVIGSGFSAADVIISTSPFRKIIHLFKWNPETRPSPLRACHHQAYPEYAGVYRQMKAAATLLSKPKSQRVAAAEPKRKKSSHVFNNRDWSATYEGIPNATVLKVCLQGTKAVVRIQLESGEVISRNVGKLQYVVGRRGSLAYLAKDLRDEVLCLDDFSKIDDQELISAKSLRAKAREDLEVAPNVFIIGSLTGDSLVRFAFGSCVYAAGKIMDTRRKRKGRPPLRGETGHLDSDLSFNSSPTSGYSTPLSVDSVFEHVLAINGGHQDLHVARRKLTQPV